jgi:tetratricopeptide (TPR) repeat protein
VDDKAFALVETLIQKYPTEAKPYSVKGDYLMAQEKELEALETYRKALQFDQSIYPIWKQVLMLEYQHGKFELLYSDGKECIEYFPAISLVSYLASVGANQTKHHQDALQICQSSLELGIEEKQLKVEITAQLAEAYFGLKQLDKGVKTYEEAISLDANNNLNKNNFAYRLALNKLNLERATKLIDEVLLQNDKASHYLDTKGFILFQQGKFTDALIFFKRALEFDAADKIIVEHMGDVQFKLGDSSKALEYWEMARILGSTNKVLEKKIKEKTFYDPIY